MPPSTHSGDGLRPPIVSPQGTGRNAHARVQSVRRQAAAQSQSQAAPRPSDDLAVEGDNERNFEEAEAAALQAYEIIDLTEEPLSQQPQIDSQGRYRYKRVGRMASLGSSNRARSIYKFGDTELKPGTCIELREPVGEWEIRFVEITSIGRSDGNVIIRGIPYARSHSLRGMLPLKRNEVCQILEVNNDDDRPDEAQCLFETTPRQILRVRNLYKTNALWPDYIYGHERGWKNKTQSQREEQAPLTCRWKFRLEYENSQQRKKNDPCDFALFTICQAEASPQLRCSDKELRLQWCGEPIIRGGSHKPEGAGQQYTVGDLYCGGGGTSRGATMAGMKVVLGADNCAVACATMERNFPDASILHEDITDLRRNGIRGVFPPIDILHLSPPCQPWCRFAYIHRHLREYDSRKDLLLGCPDLMEMFRSRVVTLEQTDGLLDPEHKEYFSAFIHGFTSRGVSIRWRKVPLIEYGLPQRRKRLVLFGVCPGEQLPPWPRATHSDNPQGDQRPYVTEAEAIRGLDSRRDPLHNVAGARVCNDTPRDGNKPFPKTILTGGAQGFNHLSGKRGLTEREIACIQGFPTEHEFVGNKTEVKRMIGNAFPSCVVKNLYEHLRKWLERVDGVQRAPAPRVARPLPAAHRRRRGVPAPTLPVEPRHHVNGDLDEDEALQLALQESMRGRPRPSASGAIVEILDDEDSPVSAVAPLLERMSIAPSDHGTDPASRNRSRSMTLGRSPGPNPGPSRRPTSSQKRRLDSMHDGEVDEVMKEASPPKRERVLENGNHEVVDDGRIASSLPRYAGPQNAQDDNENVVVGQPMRGSSQNGSVPEDRDSQRGTPVEDIATGESGTHWSSILSRARTAGRRSNEVWTF